MKSVAVITARGNSKRIPKKNIKPFCGKPIISYTIETALESGIFDEVMVSTDCSEIADIAINNGASVPFFRSKENSSDFASTADVLNEVLEQYEAYGKKFDAACCLYPTAPFITASRLQIAYNILKNTEKCNCVIPIVKYSFPPQRCLEVEDREVRYLFPKNENMRSQDLKPLYHDCGQFYFIKAAAVKLYKSMIPPHTFPIIVKESEVQDIDTFEDWILAEAKYKIIRGIK